MTDVSPDASPVPGAEPGGMGGPLRRLLTLQDRDTTLSQLRYRRGHLPEDGEVAALGEQLAALEAKAAPVRALIVDADRRQAEIEVKLVEVDAKIAAASRTLYSGSVTSSRELQSLEADIASLRRRRSELEDAELEVLVEREPLDGDAAAQQLARAELEERRSDVRARAGAARAALDSEIAAVLTERGGIAASLPEPVLARYEAVRVKNKGVGAASLEHGTCMSCRLKLPAVELDRIRALSLDALVACEECGAILVR